MGLKLIAAPRTRILPSVLALGLLAAGTTFAVAEEAVTVPGSATPQPAPPGAASTVPRIVVVEWKIKKGHEQEFLAYWATKSTIPDRSGLIAEFMSSEASHERFPWINWVNAESPDYTTFYNIGFWRGAEDFMGQIGKYIDNNKPPLPFEADHRHRIFLEPVEWRIGRSSLPGADAAGVK